MKANKSLRVLNLIWKYQCELIEHFTFLFFFSFTYSYPMKMPRKLNNMIAISSFDAQITASQHYFTLKTITLWRND